MGYIRSQSKSKDSKLLAVGHSMGGILLYALLSCCASKGEDPGLAAVVTLASSLDYSSSKSVLKLLLPLANPARALRVPAIPLGLLLAAAHNPLTSRPLNVMNWLFNEISAQNMMEPESLNKLVQNGFCSISAKLLLQLATAFQEGGLSDRSGKFKYIDHLHKSKIPILALAGDEDQICPPDAVYKTVRVIPEDIISYEVLGGSEGLHYGHYDLISSRAAAEQVYPFIIQFLCQHD